MNKTKKIRFLAIIPLGIAAVLTLCFALLSLPKHTANAESYAPSSVFSAGDGGEVGTNRPDDAEEETTYWVQFTFGDGGSVEFRRNLALKWFSAAGTSTSSDLNMPGESHYFSMQFSFPQIVFETFTISFDSAEENVSKEGLTTNSLVFTKTSAGFDAEVHDAFYDEDDAETVPDKQAFTYTDGAFVTVSFDEEGCDPGEFAVYVKVGSGDEAGQKVGTFTNIGGYYLEYRSASATTPSTPLAFESVLPAGSEETRQEVLMHSLNGQTFEVGSNGQIEDNAEPVLVVNETIHAIVLGQQFSVSYNAIDVLRSSVTTSRYVYKLDASDLHAPNLKDSDVAEEKKYNYKSLSSSAYLLPANDESETEETYVSIRFRLSDGTTRKDAEDNVVDTYVYLTWYADADAVATKGEAENAFDYIKVVPEDTVEDPKYVGLVADEVTKKNIADPAAPEAFDDAVAQYAADLTEAASKVSAGDGAYLYLPSLRSLITSTSSDYRNMRFNVYYYKPNTASTSTATSATSLRYTNLRIEVDREGRYKMRIIAQDAASNQMKYYDKNGNLVALTNSNVWDIEGIPEFYFDIGYKGPTIEDAGEQTEGRRDQDYTISDFDIVALDGYETEYTLYYLEESRLPQDFDLPGTYQNLVKNIKTVLNWDGKSETPGILDLDAAKPDGEPKILREIAKVNHDITEDDADWDKTDNVYGWDPDSSLRFCPQETGYYFVKVVVKDSEIKGSTNESWMAILVRNPVDRAPGQSKWLQNNTTAIVLFAVSAVLLIAIILLFVIKPSDKKVEDVDLRSLKGKKNGKSKKE